MGNLKEWLIAIGHAEGRWIGGIVMGWCDDGANDTIDMVLWLTLLWSFLSIRVCSFRVGNTGVSEPFKSNSENYHDFDIFTIGKEYRNTNTNDKMNAGASKRKWAVIMKRWGEEKINEIWVIFCSVICPFPVPPLPFAFFCLGLGIWVEGFYGKEEIQSEEG